MQIRLVIVHASRPHRIGIEFRRPNLIRVARQQRNIGGNPVSVLGYICPIDLRVRIGIKRLTRRRLCLHLDTRAVGLLICQTPMVVVLRAIKGNLGLPRNAR